MTAERQILRSIEVLFYPNYGRITPVIWRFQYAAHRGDTVENNIYTMYIQSNLATKQLRKTEAYADLYNRIMARNIFYEGTNNSSLLYNDYNLQPDLEFLRLYNEFKEDLAALYLMTGESVRRLPLVKNTVDKNNHYNDLPVYSLKGNPTLKVSDRSEITTRTLDEFLGPSLNTYNRLRTRISQGMSSLMQHIGDGTNFSAKYADSFLDLENDRIEVKHSEGHRFIISTVRLDL